MKVILLGGAALALLLLAGCSPLRVLNAFVPSGGYELTDGREYGPHPRQKLDVYVPDAVAHPGTLPVIVFLYGGAWQTGERAEYRFIGEALASKGFVVVIPDYRVYPEVSYPAFVEDAAAACAWAHREARRYRGDPRRMVLMGHSAGAHIAAMVAYNERFLAAHGLGRGDVRALVGLAGPYDFVPSEPAIVAALSVGGSADAAMPARYVHGGEPPSLLVTGGRDTRVEPGNQVRLARRLRQSGSEVVERVHPAMSHAGVLARLSAPLRDAGLLDEIAAFAHRHAAAAPRGS
jgi:acetyl esterase/lipase